MYFLTKSPETQLYAGAELVKWLSPDGKVGIFKASDERTTKGLRSFIEKKVGGEISEITQAEYEELEKKTRKFHVQPNREFLGQGGLHQRVGFDTARQAAESVAVVKIPTPVVVEKPAEPATPAEPVLKKRGAGKRVSELPGT